MTLPRVYLIGPAVLGDIDGRTEARLIRACEKYGLEGVWPGYQTAASSKEIFGANIALLRSADGLVADLRPFRGPHCDNGTAWQIGFAHASGIPVVGYTFNFTSLKERISGRFPQDNRMKDLSGDLVEDFGLVDNLMIILSLDSVYAAAESAIRRMAVILGKRVD